MIRELKADEIRLFIDFGDSIYKDDPHYVPYLHVSLKKLLKEQVFEKKKYTALCSFDEAGKINGRILLTTGKNKQLNTEHCGYFSHVETVNDQTVFAELMDAAADILIRQGAEYMLGTFFPYDPDDHRGILLQGYELSPMLFTSHNPPYYPGLFEAAGFKKLTDAYEYEYRDNAGIVEKVRERAERAIAANYIHISKLNYSNIRKDIEDVHQIMQIASTQINFETVLSVDEIRKIFRRWRPFINPDFAFIARRNSDNSPVGFTLSIPDYCELIQKVHGRLSPYALWVFLFQRKQIHGLRGILQYIIPEYQHKGVSKALYYETKKAIDRYHITRISLGTIMEKNIKSNGAVTSMGGELSRVYRIYYKKLSPAAYENAESK